MTVAGCSVWLLSLDPDDPDRRLLFHAKLNLAKPASNLGYQIVDGRLEWDSEPVTLDAATVLAQASESPQDLKRRTRAEYFLEKYSAGGTRIPASTMVHLARENGVAEKTLDRVKQRLGVQSQKVGFGGEGAWLWHLPDENTSP